MNSSASPAWSDSAISWTLTLEADVRRSSLAICCEGSKACTRLERRASLRVYKPQLAPTSTVTASEDTTLPRYESSRSADFGRCIKCHCSQIDRSEGVV